MAIFKNSLISSFKKLALRNVSFAIYDHLTGRSLFSFQRTNTLFISLWLNDPESDLTILRNIIASFIFQLVICFVHRIPYLSAAELEYTMIVCTVATGII
ncbi:hypothetical protein SAMN05518855_103242 [Paenibacillus sp. CF384]|nr:hypothetical protein SAMN05518855_103242 [Paenibacillus sp. CF384]